MLTRTALLCPILAISLLPCTTFAAQARDPRLAFVMDGAQIRFDTGALRGVLRPKGRAIGLADVVDARTGARISGAYGLLSHYRLFDAAHRFGPAGWEWASVAKVTDAGAVEVRWSADDVHPFDMTATYQFAAADTLDVVTTVTPKRDLPKFEVFLASYFGGFPESFIYVKKDGKGQFMPADKSTGVWLMSPRDKDAVAIITDGRWKRELNPVDWTILPEMAGAMLMRRDAKTGLTALVMAKRGDCFAISTPYTEEGHRSLYLSLFGRDLKANESAAAQARLVIAPNISDERAAAMYDEYLRGQTR